MSRIIRRGPAVRLTAAIASIALVFTAAACSSDSNTDDNAADTGTAADSDTVTDTDGDGAADTADDDADSAGDSADDADSATDDAAADDVTLTIYSGQHEDFARQLAEAFTAASGINTELRAGDDAELANQIIEEGAGSPADIFISEEPGPVGLLDTNGLLAPVDGDTLAQVDERLVPSSGTWMPYAARSRVIYYNPELISVDELPNSIMDLTDPVWKDRFAYAPSGAFTSTVSFLISDIGQEATLEWLEGIKANGINEQKNGKVRDSVEAGQHAFGLSNHYYWYFLARDQGGAENLASKVYYFDHVDPGGLLLPSGAAVVKASEHQAEAQQFLAWLGAADGGQQAVAQADSAQYPVAPGVTSESGLPPLADLFFPEVDASVYSDTTTAKDLIIKAGIA